FERPAYRIHTLRRMIMEHSVLDIYIVYLPAVDSLRTVRQIETDTPALPVLHTADRPRKPHGKRTVVHWLYNKIKGVDLIAFYRILCHVCDEHDHHILVCLPDLFRRLHSVQMRHLYIQEEDIIVGLIIIHQLAPVRKFLDTDLF